MWKLYALVLTVFITETFSQITIHPAFINPQLSSVSVRKIRDVGEPEMKPPSMDEKKNLTPPSDKVLPPFMDGIINLHKYARRVHKKDDDSSSAMTDEVAGPIHSGSKRRVARQIYMQRYPGMGRGRGFRQGGFNQNQGPYRPQGRGRGSRRGFGYPMYGYI